MLVATHPVQAQVQQPPQGVDAGIVKDIVATPSVLQVTNPINTAATLTVSATKGTEVYNPGWKYESGPTYQWFVSSDISPVPPTSPTTGTHTTVSIPAFTAAGTQFVTVKCVVTYICTNEDGLYGTIFGNGSTTVPVYAIGGPITGTNDIYWFCDVNTSTDWGNLSAASGQPAGTTYSWSMAGNAQLTGSSTSASVTYAGSGAGSMKPGDVKATVTYSLNSVSTASPPYPITVHAPVNFILKTPSTDAYTKYEGPDASDVWGFDAEHLYFRITDGLGQPMRSSLHKAYWTEKWALEGEGNGPQPDQIGGPLDDTGSSYDTFKRYSVPQPTNANGDKTVGPFTHSYNVTGGGGGFAGPDIGCPVKVYTNVTYNTFGVVGNDLPAPTK